jgi:signal transduction histidine kinase
MQADNGLLRLDICDHGVGTFPLMGVRAKRALGLQNMSEWARYAGGQLSVGQNHPHGVRVAFVAPLSSLKN